ncbi:MAG: UvrD-helicase domain-containing protein [bacterium]|nr:UvrD-helicase domain-containing protein [bacterium]
MKYITDFHIHSHYSMATSKKLIPEYLEYWARLKGINVVGTGDCVHPGWLSELKEKLEPAENGLFRLKQEFRLPESLALDKQSNPAIPREIFFMLTGEVSSIYKKNDKVRKVHNVTVFPDFESAEKLSNRLDKIGNIRSDGRPILGLDSKILLEMVLESADSAFIIPAHIWTPWFSVLGSKSGFDTIEECYEDLTQYIFAVETGLSSDPAMNWACSFLDRFKLVSNSDAHSPEKLGREANLFDAELSFQGIYSSLKGDSGFLGTVEFFPQEGKYFFDGHRKCDIIWDPVETIRHQGICPVCGNPVTRGVMYRVAELADRSVLEEAPNRCDFYSITQLPDLLAEINRVKSSKTKKIQHEYHRLISGLGSEFHLLLFADLKEIEQVGGELLAEGIRRLRNGSVIINEGFDGEFGRIKAFSEDELDSFSGNSLFAMPAAPAKEIPSGEEEKGYSIKFNVAEFQALNRALRLRSESGGTSEIGGTSESLAGNEVVSSIKQDSSAESSITPDDSSSDPAGEQAHFPGVYPDGGFTGSPEQFLGIEHGAGPCMVIAGPGSGKTRVLTERIAWLINKNNIAPENILAVTFSNKAAGEIRDRVNKRVSAPGLTISTFHAFGLSILQERYAEVGREKDFYIIDDDEKREIISEFVPDKRKINKTMKAIEAFKQGSDDSEELLTIIERYNNELKMRNAFDLSDLIFLAVELLANDPDLTALYRERFSWILIDEYQDINAIQYRLIRFLAHEEDANIFVIGDPDQAIYGFRGSDVRYIDIFKKDFPLFKEIRLTRSYRCPAPVLKVAGQVLNKEKFLAGKPHDLKVNISEMSTGKSEADWIAAQVEKMIGGVRSFSMDSGMSDGAAYDENMGFSDFCVLCRSAFMFDLFVEAFNNHGIAYQVIGSEPFYMKEPFASAISILRNTYYKSSLEDISLDAVSADIVDMIVHGEPVVNPLKAILAHNGAEEADLKRMERFAHDFDNDYDEFFRRLVLRQGVDDFDPRAEAVSIMTIHASKGLEFNTVFIPGCEEGIIPFSLFGKPEDKEREEEERLFYVGITRTEKNLFLTHAKKRLYKGRVLENERSSFLDRLEKDLLEIGKRKERARPVKDEAQLSLFG